MNVISTLRRLKHLEATSRAQGRLEAAGLSPITSITSLAWFDQCDGGLQVRELSKSVPQWPLEFKNCCKIDGLFNIIRNRLPRLRHLNADFFSVAELDPCTSTVDFLNALGSVSLDASKSGMEFEDNSFSDHFTCFYAPPLS